MNDKDMNIKIQNSGKGGVTNTKGSCAALATYLNHEDNDRILEGKDALPYRTPEGIKVSTEEVISKIDRNHAHLSKKEDKFYHMVVSPSPEEIKAMGETEKEQYESARKYIKAIGDAYAENFHRDGINSSEDILMYWKPHFTRGENDDLQLHIHCIISHRSKGQGGNSIRLSPLANTRRPQEGKMTGGFDRKLFFIKAEKLFDQLFYFERKVAESFDYNNVQKHGTPEEKQEQANKIVAEQSANLKSEITAGIERRRAAVKSRNELDEIAGMLTNRNNPNENKETAIQRAIEYAGFKQDVLTAFSKSKNKSDLEFNLVCLRATFKPIQAPNGGVSDIAFLRGGQEIPASSIMVENELEQVLGHWERMSGQKSTKTIQNEHREKESSKQKEILQHKIKIGRKF